MEPRAIQKAKRRDRIARWVITAGGMLIIFTVIGIFFLIVEVTIPLFLPPQATLRSRFPAPPLPAGTRALAVGTDRYLETGFLFRSDGVFAFFDSRSGQPLDRVRITSPGGPSARIATAELFGNLNFSVTWDDGSASVEQVRFAPRFDKAGRRTIGHEVLRLAEVPQEAGRVRSQRTL
ncbi:MAG: ABC transporter permease, partial [SAR324 cluster bacterium]|nr:ABC transporter permease [SAR324 cluster bacterium]